MCGLVRPTSTIGGQEGGSLIIRPGLQKSKPSRVRGFFIPEGHIPAHLPLQPLKPRMQAQPLLLRDRRLAQHLKPLFLAGPGLDHDGAEAFEVGEDV